VSDIVSGGVHKASARGRGDAGIDQGQEHTEILPKADADKDVVYCSFDSKEAFFSSFQDAVYYIDKRIDRQTQT
jgi:NADH:ubiquinone oxidoreductase subunit F (NADH-binding)